MFSLPWGQKDPLAKVQAVGGGVRGALDMESENIGC